MSAGWSTLGKPDFSTAAKLFYRLPADLRESLNRSEEKTLIWTIFFAWTHAHHSGRATALASFCQTWLGQQFARSRWTVARAVGKLEEMGLVKSIRRPPAKDGSFRSNLVALTARLTAIFSLKSFQPRDKSPCSKTAPQQVKNLNKRQTDLPLSGRSSVLEENPEKIEEGKGMLHAVFESLRLKKLAQAVA